MVMIPVPSLVFSRCLTGFALLVTPFLSQQRSPTATGSALLKDHSLCPSFLPATSLVNDFLFSSDMLSDHLYPGALLAAPVADTLGRKWGLITSCLVFSFGVAMQTAATAIPLFVVGRVGAGLGVGLVSTMAPMYQSECSPKWIRGAVVGLYQFGITIGILLSNIFNNATKDRPNHSSYRIPIAIQFIWAAILAFGMFLLPEVRTFVLGQ